ncbi:MAG: hypothetical protein K6A33_05125 [Clostridiales bacterium]|nr:hypothetical protein [Clostridiales bacterium]
MASVIFSVMRRRDDLPAMRWPMAVLFILLTAISGAAAARLATPAIPEDPLASQNIAGIAASLPFLPLAVMLYAQIILLWRKVASLLATPATFGMMLLFGARLSVACSLSLAILFMSYVFAVSLITKETRFRRMASLTVAAAVSLALCLAVRIGFDYGSFSAFADAYMTVTPAAIARVYETLVARAGATAVQPDISVLRTMAREAIMLAPAGFGIVCVVLAWTADCLIRRMFSLIGCPEVFTDEHAGITMPISYAMVYAAVFVPALFTPATVFPLLHAVLVNALLILALPCAAVGVRGITDWLEDRLFYMTRERALTAILLFVAFVTLRAYPFLLVTSAVGAYSVIKNHYRTKRSPS